MHPRYELLKLIMVEKVADQRKPDRKKSHV